METEAKIRDEISRPKQFHCPNCQARLTLHVKVKVEKVVLVEQDNAERNGEVFDSSSVAIESENPIVTAFIETNLWTAFSDCFERLQQGAGKPSNVYSFAERWITNGGPMQVPSATLNRLIAEFGGKIEVWGFAYIAAVISNRQVKAFLPTNILKGESFYQVTPKGAQLSKTDSKLTLPVWIRSKYGYVVGRGPFMSELRQRSFGAFAVK